MNFDEFIFDDDFETILEIWSNDHYYNNFYLPLFLFIFTSIYLYQNCFYTKLFRECNKVSSLL
jgi:hypothetical protein